MAQIVTDEIYNKDLDTVCSNMPALAGLAGTIEFMGPNGRLTGGFLPGHGFTAILIALVIALLWPNDQVCGGAFPPSA